MNRFQVKIVLVFLAVVLLQSPMLKIGLTARFGFIDYLDELLLVLLSPVWLKGVVVLSRLGMFGRIALVALAAYVVMGVISWVFLMPVPLTGLLLQTFLDLKFPLVVLTILGVGSWFWLWSRIAVILKVLLIVSGPLVVWQLLDPGSYTSFFPHGAHTSPLRVGDLAFQRAAGAFWFPGQLALVSAVVMAQQIWDHSSRKLKVSRLGWIIYCGLLLVSTLSRLEIVGALLSLGIVFALTRKARFAGERYALFTVSLAVVIFALVQGGWAYLEATVDVLQLHDVSNATTA